jgi:hypothetical protein
MLQGVSVFASTVTMDGIEDPDDDTGIYSFG